MSLGVLSYNLKRMMNREGVPARLAALTLQVSAPGKNDCHKYKNPALSNRALES